MSWRYREPQRADYDSDEEYEEAYAIYDSACTDYVERYRERCRESRRHMAED